MKKSKVLKMEFLPRKGLKVLKRASHVDLMFRTSTSGEQSPHYTQWALCKHPSLE